LNKTASTGHPGMANRDKTVGTGHSPQLGPTGQPEQVNLERTEMTGLPGHDSGVRSAVNKVAWAGQLEQDSWDRTAGTGQTCQVRTSWKGHLGDRSGDEPLPYIFQIIHYSCLNRFMWKVLPDPLCTYCRKNPRSKNKFGKSRKLFAETSTMICK
jgi:hypothetical protein